MVRLSIRCSVLEERGVVVNILDLVPSCRVATPVSEAERKLPAESKGVRRCQYNILILCSSHLSFASAAIQLKPLHLTESNLSEEVYTDLKVKEIIVQITSF